MNIYIYIYIYISLSYIPLTSCLRCLESQHRHRSLFLLILTARRLRLGCIIRAGQCHSKSSHCLEVNDCEEWLLQKVHAGEIEYVSGVMTKELLKMRFLRQKQQEHSASSA